MSGREEREEVEKRRRRRAIDRPSERSIDGGSFSLSFAIAAAGQASSCLMISDKNTPRLRSRLHCSLPKKSARDRDGRSRLVSRASGHREWALTRGERALSLLAFGFSFRLKKKPKREKERWLSSFLFRSSPLAPSAVREKLLFARLFATRSAPAKASSPTTAMRIDRGLRVAREMGPDRALAGVKGWTPTFCSFSPFSLSQQQRPSTLDGRVRWLAREKESKQNAPFQRHALALPPQHRRGRTGVVPEHAPEVRERARRGGQTGKRGGEGSLAAA